MIVNEETQRYSYFEFPTVVMNIESVGSNVGRSVQSP